MAGAGELTRRNAGAVVDEDHLHASGYLADPGANIKDEVFDAASFLNAAAPPTVSGIAASRDTGAAEAKANGAGSHDSPQRHAASPMHAGVGFIPSERHDMGDGRASFRESLAATPIATTDFAIREERRVTVRPSSAHPTAHGGRSPYKRGLHGDVPGPTTRSGARPKSAGPVAMAARRGLSHASLRSSAGDSELADSRGAGPGGASSSTAAGLGAGSGGIGDPFRAKATRAPNKGDIMFSDAYAENTRVCIGNFGDALDCMRENIPESDTGTDVRTHCRIPLPDGVDEEDYFASMGADAVEAREHLLETAPLGSRDSKSSSRDFGGARAMWAPEVAYQAMDRGLKPLQETRVNFGKQDEYALGQVMWAMMTKEPPYHGHSKERIRAGGAIRRAPPECFSKPTRRLVTSLLELDPRRRPAIKHIVERLELILWCQPSARDTIGVVWAEDRLRELRNRLLRKLPGTRRDTITQFNVEDSLLASFVTSERGRDPRLLEELVNEMMVGPF